MRAQRHLVGHRAGDPVGVVLTEQFDGAAFQREDARFGRIGFC
jgi:hypothetical protein